jgi:hypothetical protein
MHNEMQPLAWNVVVHVRLLTRSKHAEVKEQAGAIMETCGFVLVSDYCGTKNRGDVDTT